MIGMAAMTIHAPGLELRDRDDDQHDAGRDGADPVDDALRRHPCPAQRHRRTIPACDSVNAVNTPTT